MGTNTFVQSRGMTGVVAVLHHQGGQGPSYLGIKWDDQREGFVSVADSQRLEPLSGLPRVQLDAERLSARVDHLAWWVGASVFLSVACTLWTALRRPRTTALPPAPVFPPVTAVPRFRSAASSEPKEEALWHELQSRLNQLEVELRSRRAGMTRPAATSDAVNSSAVEREVATLKQRLERLGQEQQRWQADVGELKGKVLSLAGKRDDTRDVDAALRRVAEAQQAAEQDLDRLERQVAALVNVLATTTNVSPPASEPLRSSPVEVRLSREEIGRRFATYCRREHEFLEDRFEAALAAECPGVPTQPKVSKIYRPTAAQESYFCDEREGPSLVYWRVTWEGAHYLLPCPTGPASWAGQQGFVVPLPVSPASLQSCLPATLRLNHRRWEVVSPGKLA